MNEPRHYRFPLHTGRDEGSMNELAIDMVTEERASEDDREWFLSHPHRHYRLRPILMGELGAQGSTHVVVRQVELGVRCRIPVLIIGPEPLDNDTQLERFAEAIVRDGGAILHKGLVDEQPDDDARAAIRAARNLEVPLLAQLAHQGGQMRTSIYQHGDDVSVVTDARDERDFTEAFANAFCSLVAKDNGNGVTSYRGVLSAAFDIIARMRGYKAETVQERRVMVAGRWPHPSEVPVANANTESDPDIDVEMQL